MKYALILAVLLATTTANAEPSIGAMKHPACGEFTSQVTIPTPACGFNDLSVPNPGIFMEYRYWNGNACATGRRFLSCANGP